MLGDIKQLAQYAINVEPRLLAAATMRLGGPGALLAEPPKRADPPPAGEPGRGQAAGPQAPSTAEGAAAPAAGPPPLSELGLGDVQIMLQELGPEYVNTFCATHQLQNLS